MDYQVIEDNGGGLHLYLFRPGESEPIEGYTGWEYDPGQLAHSLDLLDAGEDTHGWEGAIENLAEHWQYIQAHEFGYEVICYSENGQRTLRPERMGRAGQIEFGIESE